MLKFRKRDRNQRKSAGFTLTEILVSVLLGSLIVVGLMGLVIELLTTDARETARTETEREMQMALDYISRDVREAVYVYDGGCLAGVNAKGRDGKVKSLGTQCKGIAKSLPSSKGGVPILAFWRLDDLPDGVGCGTGGKEGFPCLAGRTYTLGEPWKGLARIERYELPRYRSDGTEGYNAGLDPSEIKFIEWPGNSAPNYNRGNQAVLVDFVDKRSLDNADLKKALGGKTISVDCPPEYVLTPDESALTGSFKNVRNFYACVKVPEDLKPTTAQEEEAGAFNQKVILFVRGNASGKPGIKTANEGYMPSIATQVLNRGVKDKVPQ
jgi:type II secretory pathway pseudopilin PulG